MSNSNSNRATSKKMKSKKYVLEVENIKPGTITKLKRIYSDDTRFYQEFYSIHDLINTYYAFPDSCVKRLYEINTDTYDTKTFVITEQGTLIYDDDDDDDDNNYT